MKSNLKTADACRVGYIIRQRRSECRMSQLELSRLTGYCNTYFSRIENGYEMPSLAAMIRICRILDLSMDEIFCLKEEPQKDNQRQVLLQAVTMMPDKQVHMVSDMLNKMHVLNREMAAPMIIEDAIQGK